MKHGGSIHKRVMYYAQQEKEVLYCDLNIKDTGYTERQAEKSREKYGSNLISERHRHRYEFNSDFLPEFEKAGWNRINGAPQ